MKKILFLVCVSMGATAFAQSGYVRDAMMEKYGEPGTEKGMDWINNKMLNVEIKPQYTFPVSLIMHTTSYKNEEKTDESDINYFFNTPANIVGIKTTEQRKKKSEEMFIIYDFKANAMLMLNEKDKTGMAINMNAFMSGEQIERREQGKYSKSGKASNTECKKTGKTKTILGYPCFEYVCVNDDDQSRSEMWITTKLPFDLSKTASRSPMGMYYSHAAGLGGMMMAAKFYKRDQLNTEMEVTNVDNNANKVVNSKDYKFNKM